MIVFALCSTGKTAEVSILQDDAFLYSACHAGGFTHSETLLPLCAGALEACALSPTDIDCYAVCVGPGSFTGLRIGLATVKGMALPHSTPVAAVSTLEAIAAGCEANGTIVAALDARRQEVYWAAFQKQGQALHRLTPDSAGSLTALSQFVESCHTPLFFVGDGAHLCYNVYGNKSNIQLYAPPLPHAGLGTALVGAKMAAAGQLCSAAALQPSYLRLSQAQRERAEKLAHTQNMED